MKFLRHGPRGAERPGLLDREGRVRDLAALLPDITPTTLGPLGQAALRTLDVNALPIIDAPGRLGLPWSGIGKCVCVGLNYIDHANEAAMALPKEPILFHKPVSALGGAFDPVVLPRDSVRSDWEVELGVVIGSTARYLSPEAALSYVAGYCVVNDLSERDYQLERGGTWDKGKGCDTFGPVGPWLVTADEVRDPQDLQLWLDLNGQRQQSGHTRDMIFGVAQLVSYISHFMTLYPGDLIATGTPAGVGMGQKPPRHLKPGDQLHLGITGLGEQHQSVHPWNPELLALADQGR